MIPEKFKSCRLAKLAAFLRTVPPENFDMRTWRRPCGTAACAVGWACSIPEFRDAGLILREGSRHKRCFFPEFKGAANLGAAISFFGIRAMDASELFLPWSWTQRRYRLPSGRCAHASEVADAIEYLLSLNLYETLP